MDQVKFLRLLAGNSHALLGNDPQARLLDYGIDGAGQIALGRVWLEDRKSTLDLHQLFLQWEEWRIHESSLEKTGRAAYTGAAFRRQDRALNRLGLSRTLYCRSAACPPVIECSRGTTPGATSGYLTRAHGSAMTTTVLIVVFSSSRCTAPSIIFWSAIVSGCGGSPARVKSRQAWTRSSMTISTSCGPLAGTKMNAFDDT